MRLWLIAAILFLTHGLKSHAAPFQTLIRQTRTMAMGGAGVGLADDDYALFQNPAGLAAEADRKFKLIGVGAEASWDTYSLLGTSFSAVNNFKLSDLNKLMGKNVDFRADIVPMVRLPNFAIAYVFDFQGSVNEFNQANPYFDLGYMTTQGIQAGWATSVKQGKKAHDEWRFGGALKVLWRRGGFYNISTAGFLQLSNTGKAYVDELVGGYGMGFGADVGTQYVNHIDKETTISFGSSITDIADTRFSDPHASPLPMSVNLGVGYKKEFQALTLAFAADLRHLSQRGDFANKTHFGVEASIPIFDFYFGVNQLNPSYGIGFDIWVLRLTLASFAEELGVLNHQNTSRKTVLQADFNLPI